MTARLVQRGGAATKKAAPRTRQPARTREQILVAATEEFAASGLGGARVDKIARRAGANKRMLYHYFGNKEDLFLAVMERTYEHIRQRESALRLEELAPVEAMRKFVEFTFNYFSENPHFVNLLNSENLHRARHIRRSGRVEEINSPVLAALGRILERGRAEGVFRAKVDPTQFYITVAGVCYFYFSNIHTLSTIFGRDFQSKRQLAEREKHVTEVVLGYLRA